MDVLRLEAALLRAQLPELQLRPGMVLGARVLERAGRHGVLLLAGAALSAELPDGVPPGTRLRLRISEVDADRVVMRVVPEPATPDPAAAGAAVALTLPDGRGAAVRLAGRPHPGDGRDEAAAVELRYESRVLGPLGLRLTLDAGGVRATVSAARGEPEAFARRAASELQEALAAATGRPAAVRVVAVPPEPTLDLRA